MPATVAHEVILTDCQTRILRAAVAAFRGRDADRAGVSGRAVAELAALLSRAEIRLHARQITRPVTAEHTPAK